MSDIAQRAGVSRPTVSVILNERHELIGIAEETRQKVLRVAEEMGYRRNELARAVKTGKSRTIGFMAGTADMEYASRYFSGATDGAEDRGFSIQRFRISNADQDRTAVVRCVEHRLAGAIVYDPDLRLPFETMQREFDAHELPAVLLDRKTPHSWGINVASDDEMGARLAVEHLADLRHQHIVFMGGIEGVGTAIPRLAGYQKAMQERGLGQWIRAIWTNWQTETMPQILSGFMAEAVPPTAIICGSDPMALGLLRRLRAMGKNVPRDISILGFGDLLRTDLSDPALTTVAVPYEQMGREAVRLLIELGAQTDRKTASEQGNGSEILVPTRLVVRHSTAQAPSGA